MMRVFTLVFLAGCLGSVDEDNYADKYSPQWCQKSKQCERGKFDDEWSDLNDCVDEVSEDIEDLIDFMDDADCDFEDDNALECLQALVESDCEDFYERDYNDECTPDKVWDC